jgi:hypothetical protein
MGRHRSNENKPCQERFHGLILRIVKPSLATIIREGCTESVLAFIERPMAPRRYWGAPAREHFRTNGLLKIVAGPAAALTIPSPSRFVAIEFPEEVRGRRRRVDSPAQRRADCTVQNPASATIEFGARAPRQRLAKFSRKSHRTLHKRSHSTTKFRPVGARVGS